MVVILTNIEMNLNVALICTSLTSKILNTFLNMFIEIVF